MNTAAAISVSVRLFAAYREAAGTRALDVSLPADAHVADLIRVLEPRIPALTRAPGLVAVNQTYVPADHVLHDRDEVALIPPVSGGCA